MLYRGALKFTQWTARSSLPVKDGRMQLPRDLGALSHPGSAASPLTELFQYRALLVTSAGPHLPAHLFPITTARDSSNTVLSFANRTSKNTYKIIQFYFRRNSNLVSHQLTHNSLCCRVSADVLFTAIHNPRYPHSPANRRELTSHRLHERVKADCQWALLQCH